MHYQVDAFIQTKLMLEWLAKHNAGGRIVMECSGGGDSGSCDYAEIMKADGSLVVLPGKLESCKGDLFTQIEQDLMMHCNWWDNEGGSVNYTGVIQDGGDVRTSEDSFISLYGWKDIEVEEMPEVTSVMKTGMEAFLVDHPIIQAALPSTPGQSFEYAFQPGDHLVVGFVSCVDGGSGMQFLYSVQCRFDSRLYKVSVSDIGSDTAPLVFRFIAADGEVPEGFELLGDAEPLCQEAKGGTERYRVVAARIVGHCDFFEHLVEEADGYIENDYHACDPFIMEVREEGAPTLVFAPTFFYQEEVEISTESVLGSFMESSRAFPQGIHSNALCSMNGRADASSYNEAFADALEGETPISNSDLDIIYTMLTGSKDAKIVDVVAQLPKWI